MIRLRSTQQDPEGDISTLSGATAVQSPKRPTSRRQPGTAIPPQSPPKSTPTDILMAADKARSKRLIDRQETAVRVSGKHYDEEGSEEEQQQEQQPPRPRVTKSRKRARTPEEDDFDQFEEQPDNAADERAKKRRAIKPVVSATRTQPKQAVTAAVQSVGTRSERPRASQSREVVRSASSEETQPALLKAPLAQPRTKRPWSEKESAHLLKMMEQYGCSWARLKSIDQQDENIFEFRNQDALKDRARNMKIDFLRCVSRH